MDLSFYQGKRVFVTGHTGFKGAWLTKILINVGAKVTGYSLPPPTNPALFEIANLQEKITHIEGDIRNLDKLQKAFNKAQPEIVLHLAAQPLVRDSYKEPRYTYETNVMGTVNILECVRSSDCVKSFLNVTTDKVYKNFERDAGYREDEMLDGFDPYSNSKSCSELVTHSYKNSFPTMPPISTARAGNVIGGGDFSKNRIIPDCIRAVQEGRPISVRNPFSTRPYQHVLEPLMTYLMIAKAQYENPAFSGWYNVGPDGGDCVTTGDLVSLFCQTWGDSATWINQAESNAPHEATFLKLDSTKLKETFNWSPRWHIQEAIEKTCDWTKAWISGNDIARVMDLQIQEYLEN